MDKVLTKSGIGKILLGAPFEKIREDYSIYKFKEEPEFWGYTFSDSKESFRMFLTVINDTLEGITLNDTNFRLDNGLRVGDPISRIKKEYPNLTIYFDHHDEVEYFEMFEQSTVLRIEVESNEQGYLGKYNSEVQDSATEYNINGKILTLGMFRNK